MNLWSHRFSQNMNEKLSAFLPCSELHAGQKSWQFFAHILGETMTLYIHSEIYWPLEAKKKKCEILNEILSSSFCGCLFTIIEYYYSNLTIDVLAKIFFFALIWFRYSTLKCVCIILALTFNLIRTMYIFKLRESNT